MLQRLRHRAHGQEGFTLIELLVVVLIIGILAAVAIPVFLNQTTKANDANVKSNINAAATAEETYYTDSQAYTVAGGTASSTDTGYLTAINPALTNAFSGDENLTITQPSGDDYVIQADDPTVSGLSFTLTKASDGITSYSCSPAGTGGCPAAVAPDTDGNWGSSS